MKVPSSKGLGVVILAATTGLLACGEGRPPRSPVGDDGWGPSLRGESFAAPEPTPPPAPRARPIPEEERRKWAHAATLGELVDLEVRGASEHDDDRYERTIRVSAPQADAYRHLTQATVMPPGTIVVQRHHEPGQEAVAIRYAMVKEPGPPDAWQFVVLDDELRVAADAQLDLCDRCHREAPFHGLFGIPSPP